MKQVAEIIGERPHVVRYWCDQFGINPKRSRGNERLFSAHDIARLKKVRFFLRVREYTIKGARRRLYGW